MNEFDSNLKIALAQHGKAMLRNDADQMYKAYKKQQKARRVRMVYTLSAAAVFCLLAVSVLFFQSGTSHSPEQLYADYYAAPAASMTRKDGDPEAWQNALIAYNKKEYSHSIELLQSVLSDPAFKQQDAARYYQGQAYLGLKQLPAAIEAFQKVQKNSLLYPDAQWFMALAYLAHQQKEKSAAILNNIAADDTHHKQKQARQLLQELRK
jgi:tetratricopeptide (TPR) repeat protein